MGDQGIVEMVAGRHYYSRRWVTARKAIEDQPEIPQGCRKASLKEAVLLVILGFVGGGPDIVHCW